MLKNTDLKRKAGLPTHTVHPSVVFTSLVPKWLNDFGTFTDSVEFLEFM